MPEEKKGVSKCDYCICVKCRKFFSGCKKNPCMVECKRSGAVVSCTHFKALNIN